MAKRITIMIDNEIDRKVRNLQAKIIQKESDTCSFSRVVNELLKKALK